MISIKETGFEGLLEIQPTVFADDRGYFLEIYNNFDLFKNKCKDVNFVQDNMSKSKKGVLRGLHYQTRAQCKLVQVVSGLVLDVVVDLRNDSKTFGKYYKTYLDADKHNQLYVPKGFAHGFYVLSDEATFLYKCSDYYDKSTELGLDWNDKTLNINWELQGEPILSEKDTKYKNCPFNYNEKYFDMEGNWILYKDFIYN